jgi:hypothetical protein
MENKSSFFPGIRKLFAYYKELGERAIAQLDEQQIAWRPNDSSNSIALLVHHLTGNMLSRFTDFLTSDGEKPWRDREAEFDAGYESKTAMMQSWEKGWAALFSALNDLTLKEDENRVVYIRNEGHSVQDALLRQLAHYASHVGQIIYIAKLQKGDAWESLSIPKGASRQFNDDKFSREKGLRHFTDKA